MLVSWLEQSEPDLPAGDAWLSPEERRVLAAFRFAKRRREWLLGRWTAKCAVAASLRRPPALSEIVIRAAPSGAPEVLHSGVPPLTISISHRAGRACCAVAGPRVELGCDLEMVEPRTRVFVEDYFTIAEQRLVYDTPPDQRSLVTALVWSAKESALKALQVGLRADTRSVVVDIWRNGELPLDCERWRPLRVSHGGGVFAGWWRCSGTLIRTIVTAPCQPPPEEVIPLSVEN